MITRVWIATLSLTLAIYQSAAAEITVERSERGAIVKVDGQPFAEYLTCSGHQPAVWPLIGPTGKPMTRSYPAGPLLDGEVNDHTHHHSLWFAHGNVNGLDFWTNREQSNQDTVIRHRKFVEIAGGETGSIVTLNDWRIDCTKVLEDERRLVFGTDEFGRYVDFQVTLTASETDVTFGDTKEGAFAIRASAPLTVDTSHAAHLVNDSGKVDGDVWGMYSSWIDDYGSVDGEVLGIAMFNHPSNLHHPTRWHARTYGLLAANPFGEKEFPPDGQHAMQGAVCVKRGQSITLRYRVLLHAGTTVEAKVADAYLSYANESQHE